MTTEKVIIAGGGIGGLTLGLTLHQIGVPFVVLESSCEERIESGPVQGEAQLDVCPCELL